MLLSLLFLFLELFDLHSTILDYCKPLTSESHEIVEDRGRANSAYCDPNTVRKSGAMIVRYTSRKRNAFLLFSIVLRIFQSL